MKPTLICLLIVTVPLAVAATAAEVNKPDDAGGPSDALSPDQVVNEVLRNNPSLKAARANWEAMKQRIPQARAWEDARVGVDVERMGTTRFDTFTDNEWMAAQELPLSGKNRKRGQAAVAEAAAAFEEFRRRELDLTARARAACYRRCSPSSASSASTTRSQAR